MKNLNLQLFSLLVALLLALFVNSESNSSVLGFVVPVEIRNLPTGKTILLQSNTQVQVTIKGPSFLISRVVSSLPIFKVNIPSEVQNRFVATLNSSDLALPPYVQVLSIEPSEIEFTFDNMTNVDLPVVVPRIGSLPENLRLGDISIEPPTVTVTGPESEVRELRGIETFPVDLRDLHSDLDKTINLRNPSRLSKLSQQQVDVRIKVSSVQSELRFSSLPIEIRAGGGKTHEIAPNAVNVQISGAREILALVAKEQVIPYVRIQDSSQPGTELQVAVELPKGVEASGIEPAKVRLVK